MNIQGRLETLLQFIRRARRRASGVSLLVAIMLLILFVGGSYAALFAYYEKVVQLYYVALLRNVSQYQQRLIGKQTYWKDIEHICTLTARNRGVVDSWCTDRFGKLIFSTNETLNSEFRGKRLPTQFYESINQVWEFRSGLPVVKKTAVDDALMYRLSIPIYAFGQELNDFVLGVDVKRFAFLPRNPRSIVLFTVGFVLFSVLLLHLPLFAWNRRMFGKIESQARSTIGAIQVEAGRSAISLEEGIRGEPLPQQAAGEGFVIPQPEEGYAEEEEEGEEYAEEEEEEEEEYAEGEEGEQENAQARAEAQEQELEKSEYAEVQSGAEAPEEREPPSAPETEEYREETAAARTPDEGERFASLIEAESPGEEEYEEPRRVAAAVEKQAPPVPTESEIAGMENKLRTNPILYLMDVKQSLFRKKSLSLDFLEAVGCTYHSKSSEGSYFIYLSSGALHLFAAFSYPFVNHAFAADQLTEIAEYFRSAMGIEPQIRHLFKTLNLYCIDNNLHIDLSSVLIREDEQKMEYSSCGKGEAVYLKNEENVVKVLKLDITGLGRISDADFEETFSYAEIDFSQGDIFMLLPQNADEVMIEGESMTDVMKREMLDQAKSGADQVAASINGLIEPYKKKERKFPETGFVLFKFT